MLKSITFSADERLIEEAREKAQAEYTTLNEEFRRWLAGYVNRENRADRAMRTIRELQGRVVTHGPYTRDEMNER
jgi:hypothetical protein